MPAAALLASCLHRADHAPTPANRPVAVGGTRAPAAVAPGPVANSTPAPPTPESNRPRSLSGSRVGTVRAIGTDSRFVLLETSGPDGAPAVADGQELRCIHADAADADGPFAVVRVSRERRPPFIVADVLSGQPRTGDDVYTAKGQGTAPFPGAWLHPVGGLPVHPGCRSPAGRVRRFPRHALTA